MWIYRDYTHDFFKAGENRGNVYMASAHEVSQIYAASYCLIQKDLSTF